MDNLIFYAQKELEPFSQRPVSPVDSLILSWVSYMNLPAALPAVQTWEGVRLADLFRAEAFPAMLEEIWDPESSLNLLTVLAASPRFRDIRVMGYAEQKDMAKEQQFAAVTFRLEKGLYYIAFRGTDHSLVGWKEDFNMAFQYPIPSQEQALIYTETAAMYCDGSFLLGGHSKGGNLAVYSGANCSDEVYKRIRRIYSHDGPGFLEQVLKSPAFARITPLIDKTVPQSSVVGMLLEQQEKYRVVKSKSFSVWQHDPFSWVVEGTDFQYLDDVAPEAKYLDRTLTTWITRLSPQEREWFVDTLYRILNANEAETFEQMRADWQKTVPAVAHAASQVDGQTRQFLFRTLRQLAVLGVKNVPSMFRSDRFPKEEQ